MIATNNYKDQLLVIGTQEEIDSLKENVLDIEKIYYIITSGIGEPLYIGNILPYNRLNAEYINKCFNWLYTPGDIIYNEPQSFMLYDDVR